MKEPSDATVLVFDGGLNVELALRLARSFKRVLYQCSIESPYPKVHESVIGDGFDEIERIRDFWTQKDEIDGFIFPDCANAGLQRELACQGLRVWGSRDGCEWELDRERFKKILKKVGLEVGPYSVVLGLSQLRDHLRDKEDKWIKISRWRGCRETWHWIDQATSGDELDLLAVCFGAVKEQISFIVEDAIETEIEWGYDGYFCGGEFPSLSAHGPEIKDSCYLASVVQWDDLPEQVREINSALAPLLRDLDYANMWSAEVRITKEGTGYLTDPTTRFPWPASAAQMELYGNLPEIIWGGLTGVCIDPKPVAKFAAECLINHKGDESNWRKLVVPSNIRRWVKLSSVCQVDEGVYAFPPMSHSFEAIGSVIGIGDTIEEALNHLKVNAEELSDQPVEVKVESLASGIKELAAAEDQGVAFSEQKLPDAAEVIA